MSRRVIIHNHFAAKDSEPKFRKGQIVRISDGIYAPGEGQIVRVKRMPAGTPVYEVKVTKAKFPSLVGETGSVLETDLN